MLSENIIDSDPTTENLFNYELLNEKQKSIFLVSWSQAIAGKNAHTELPGSNEELITTLNQSMDTELEGHINSLAAQQGKTLQPLPEIPTQPSSADQLQFLQTLTSNIHAVQNRKMSGITPHLSKTLNGMDCSMSTWTMQHETNKAGLSFMWGSPIGHAIGIITLSDGQTYYADGQSGFIEKIETETIPLLHGGKIITIKNFADIQARHQTFFPQYVYSDENANVAATMTNIDSMLYKQETGKITDDLRQQYGEEDMVIVEQLQPFARQYQESLQQIDTDLNKKILNEIIDSLFPSVQEFRNSDQASEDETRLRARK